MVNLAVWVLLAVFAPASQLGRLELLKFANELNIPISEGTVIRLLGNANGVTTFGPPGDYIKFLDYYDARATITISSKGVVAKEGVNLPIMAKPGELNRDTSPVRVESKSITAR